MDYTVNINNNDPGLQFVIKADNNTEFDTVDKVLSILKKGNHHKIHLITELKSIPEGTPAYEAAKQTEAEG